MSTLLGFPGFGYAVPREQQAAACVLYQFLDVLARFAARCGFEFLQDEIIKLREHAERIAYLLVRLFQRAARLPVLFS